MSGSSRRCPGACLAACELLTQSPNSCHQIFTPFRAAVPERTVLVSVHMHRLISIALVKLAVLVSKLLSRHWVLRRTVQQLLDVARDHKLQIILPAEAGAQVPGALPEAPAQPPTQAPAHLPEQPMATDPLPVFAAQQEVPSQPAEQPFGQPEAQFAQAVAPLGPTEVASQSHASQVRVLADGLWKPMTWQHVFKQVMKHSAVAFRGLSWPCWRLLSGIKIVSLCVGQHIPHSNIFL